jgi:tetratricopeptide (TPR) repeat protein
MLEKEGREEELIPIYNSTLTLKGQPETLYGEVHKRLARIHAKKGRKAEAASHYKEALRFNPEDSAAKREAAELDRK